VENTVSRSPERPETETNGVDVG